MEYRSMGRSGLQLSALSFGSWVTFGLQVDEGVAQECLCAAYDHGINFFDNAEGYARGNSEIWMGRILKAMNWPRDTFLVSSKVFFGVGREGPNQIGLSRKHIIEACHGALKRLRVDYLDLYMCHRYEPEYPVDEIVWTMNDLLKQGKILYWGTSKWPAEKIQEAIDFADAHYLRPPIVEQPQYNMFFREPVEKDYLPFYENPGMGMTTFSPLYNGLLTGKYQAGIPEGSRMSLPQMRWKLPDFQGPEFESKLKRIEQLIPIAADLGGSMAQLAIAWCLKNPHVSSVILGASRASQLHENVKALDIYQRLDDSMMAHIDSILNNNPLSNP